MILRDNVKKMNLLMREFPAVALLGPRQVGKTTLAKAIASRSRRKVVYLDLERASDRRKIDDPESFFELNRDKLIVLDEIQLLPGLFSALRPEIDEARKPGRFLLTGSASPELVEGVSESLAGRIAYEELTPLSLTEARSANIEQQKHWFRGGFPPALTAKSHDAFQRWAEHFIRSYVERDLSSFFGVSLSPVIIRNFWEMLAHNTGTILNIEHYARSLGVSGPTAKRYLDFLEAAFLVRRLSPWFTNSSKRLVKSPKMYVRDSGLVHTLCGVHTPSDLPGHPVVGGSWEGYVVEEVVRALPPGVRPFFYRTQHGAEADLVLVKRMKPVACIEIKYSKAPSLSPGFYQSVEDLKTTKNWVVYTGDDSYMNTHKVRFMPLAELLTKHLPSL
jgi:predicted AAA+ superfamily ATPase